MDAPANLQALFEIYKKYYQVRQCPKGLIANTKTMLDRQVVPALGGVKPGERATEERAKYVEEFLGKQSLEKLAELSLNLESFMEAEKIPKTEKRKVRSYFKKLVDWTIAQGWLETPQDNTVNSFNGLVRINRSPGNRRTYASELKISKRKQKSNYRLGACPGDYVNPQLQNQIEHLKKFLVEELHHSTKPDSTLDVDLMKLMRVLGWLHRYKGVSLEDLRLELIVAFTNVKPDLTEFHSRTEYLDRKFYLEETAKVFAQKTVALAKEYIKFAARTKETRIDLVSFFIMIAKFLYRDETDRASYDACQDIEVVKQLHKLLRDEKKAKNQNNVPSDAMTIEDKILDWDTVLYVLNCMKIEADQEFYTQIKKQQKLNPKKGCKYRRPLKARGIARRNRAFLMTAFLVLLPPDRQQIIRDMRIGFNIRKGCIFKGKFVPEEQMQGSQYSFIPIEWYQYTGDYKTVSIHGDFWGRIPNFNLGNKDLYHYIDLWLTKYRPLLLVGREDPGFFFIGPDTGKQLGKTQVWSLVREAFFKFAGVPVNPHALRHCYNTHLEVSHAPEDVKAAARHWMKHKEETVEENYLIGVKTARVEPVLSYNEKMTNAYFAVSKKEKH